MRNLTILIQNYVYQKKGEAVYNAKNIIAVPFLILV